MRSTSAQLDSFVGSHPASTKLVPTHHAGPLLYKTVGAGINIVGRRTCQQGLWPARRPPNAETHTTLSGKTRGGVEGLGSPFQQEPNLTPTDSLTQPPMPVDGEPHEVVFTMLAD